MTARTLMVQGTSSSAGKSLLVTALCRIFARKGIRVAPFKAQNMSNNAAVCNDGGEIGRSQALQAMAAGIAPEVDMNPVLLKPEADAHSQVIVRGRPWKRLAARAYYQYRQDLWSVIADSLDRLRSRYELVIMEGAGSPAELNLRAGDIVNMAVARYAQTPVVLVGDIDRGGIFAQLLGTLWLLPEEERSLICGLVINKFRGDPSLFDDGVRLLEEKGSKPILGIVPWLHELVLPEEDAVALEQRRTSDNGFSRVHIAVIHFPRISNFDDFDALADEPAVQLRYVKQLDELGQPDVIILPGTKSTISDLCWLNEGGLGPRIQQLAQEGTRVVGICGGYQMLGERILDPHHVESPLSEVAGLGLLPVQTVFATDKETRQVKAIIELDPHCRGCRGEMVSGYEIHTGRTISRDGWLRIEHNPASLGENDGAVSPNGRIWGCYLHGLFDNDAFRAAWLRQLGVDDQSSAVAVARGVWSERVEQSLDHLADVVQTALDMRRLESIVWEKPECVLAE